MDFQTRTWLINGLPPGIMQHNPEGSMLPPEPGTTRTKKIPSPADEAEGGTYRNEDGSLYHPATAWLSAYFRACVGRKNGSKAMTTVSRGHILLAEDRLNLLHQVREGLPDKPLMDFSRVDIRRVRLPSGASVMRARPVTQKWAGYLFLNVNLDAIEEELITKLLNIAGYTIGVGECRPTPASGKGAGGPFGRFTAKLIAKIPEIKTDQEVTEEMEEMEELERELSPVVVAVP